MSKWILVLIVIATGDAGGAAVREIEFADEEACKRAEAQASANAPTWGDLRAFCTPYATQPATPRKELPHGR